MIIKILNYKVKIDKEDYDKIKGISWFIQYPSKRNNKPYVRGNIHKNNKVIKCRLHRFILGLNSYNNDPVDHINGDTLDNRKINLRIVNSSENSLNRTSLNSNNTSGYHGVSYDKTNNCYRAYVQINKKRKFLGTFKTDKEAYIKRSCFLKGLA